MADSIDSTEYGNAGDNSPCGRHPNRSGPPDSTTDHLTTKQRLREKIEREIAQYLAGGKTISQVDHTSNHSYHQPIKRNRKDNAKYSKKFARV